MTETEKNHLKHAKKSYYSTDTNIKSIGVENIASLNSSVVKAIQLFIFYFELHVATIFDPKAKGIKFPGKVHKIVHAVACLSKIESKRAYLCNYLH